MLRWQIAALFVDVWLVFPCWTMEFVARHSSRLSKPIRAFALLLVCHRDISQMQLEVQLIRITPPLLRDETCPSVTPNRARPLYQIGPTPCNVFRQRNVSRVGSSRSLISKGWCNCGDPIWFWTLIEGGRSLGHGLPSLCGFL